MSGGWCAVRRGFFVLRPCGHPAIGVCGSCGRPVCAEHGQAAGGGVQCIECAARLAGQQQRQIGWHDRTSAFALRDRYYHSHTPTYWHGSTYTTDDYTPFEHGPTDGPRDEGDEGGGGFYDS